jgi:hypothetical protein
MKLLVRKIERAKWMQKDVVNGATPSADAVTGSLRTKNNTLSVWQIENLDELEDAVIAFVCQGQHLDTVDVVSFTESALSERKLGFRNTPAKTPHRKFVERHYDVCDLDYDSLGRFSLVIVDCLRKESIVRFTHKQLKDLVRQAVADGRVAIEDLNKNVASAVVGQ